MMHQRKTIYGRKENLKIPPNITPRFAPFKYYDKPKAQVYEKLFLFSDKDLSVEKNLCEN
ncbi:hypothetical protein HYS92_01045 [Candidatus Daviesbacteria bacterium]|nr:hypothetical protein [Candidatus Daviesbacteria bacterium]